MVKSLYKYSQYNIEIDHRENGDTFICNTYSSNGKWINKQDFDDIKNKTNIDICDVPEYLAKAGFIVPVEVNEYKRLLKDNKNILEKPNMLDLTIAVTRSCNYNCVYCFEKNELGVGNISNETIDEIIKFIEKKLKEHNFKSIRIVYFGGEPLLNISAIKEIDCRLKAITSIPIIGHITTNGRFLTKEVAKELQNCNIQSAQITLDGLPKEYAKLKGCTESDFYSVIDNIKNVYDTIRIEIRINVGIDNAESVKKLISFLADEQIKCTIYIDNIKYYEHNKSEFMSDYDKYVASYKDIIDFVYSNGYNKFFYKLYPCRTCTSCQANMPYYFAIDTNGYIYKCPDFIFKKEFIIGNVHEGITVPSLNNIFIDNKLYDKCVKCAYRPICNGLCTTDRIIFNKGVNCEALQKWYNYRILMRLKNLCTT